MSTHRMHVVPRFPPSSFPHSTMSDLNDANADPAIEQVIRMIYSAVRLTDLTINLRADSHPNLLPYNTVFVKCTMNDIVVPESTMIKEAESTCWKLTENIQISTEIPLFKLSIFSRYPGHDDHILAQFELTTVGLILDIAAHDRRWSQVINKLDNNDPALELTFRVVVVPSELSSNPPSANGNSLVGLPTTNGQARLHLLFNNLINTPAFLNHRGKQCLERFDQFGREDDLQNGIYALDRSVSFTSDSHPNKPPRLNRLCSAFMRRFKLLGDSRDIDKAIKFGNDAVTLADGDRHNRRSFFNNLSNSYLCRFEFLGNQDDLNSAVSAAELAVSVSAEGNRQKPHPGPFYTLSYCLEERYKRLGELDDIKSAIEMGQRAFSFAAEGDELKHMALHMLAGLFLQRFKHLGKSDDLEQSISEGKSAADLTPEGYPGRYLRLHGLSVCLRERFELFDDPADLDEAIVKGMDAMNAMPSTCSDKPGVLNNVGLCFFNRFQLNGDPNDLTEAISLLQSALSDTTDGRIDRPGMLANLGLYLHHRFRKTKDASDLDGAVSARRHAVDGTPDAYGGIMLLGSLRLALRPPSRLPRLWGDKVVVLSPALPRCAPNGSVFLNALFSSVFFGNINIRKGSECWLEAASAVEVLN
ncbi:hypothetical protein IW262DRAFT_1497130 [Armillaria fumosa]|nr:hypothetical protein IW262DRAFT_1497130 [Armillaria fumosa]